MKAESLKDLTLEELAAKIAEQKKSLGSYKLNHAVSPLENPMVIRSTRKEIARLQTELSNRK